jgi:hypothetical protein
MIDPVQMAQAAAEQLTGTCQSISDLGEEFENLENDAKFCARLDELIFCCSKCDWWCDQSEMSEKEDWVCDECEED